MTIFAEAGRRRPSSSFQFSGRDGFAAVGAIYRRSRWLGAVAVGLVVPIAILALWSLAVRLELLAPQILPAPSLVWTTLSEFLISGDLPYELGVSMLRLAAGIAIGAGLGLATGVALGLSHQADDYLGASVRAVFLVPSLGWLPFFMLMFGIDETLKVVLIAKTCFLPLMVGPYHAIRTMPSKYDDIARCLELKRTDYLRKILLPALLPSIATGLRQAVSKGWKVLILVEMISSAAGIGYLMMWGRKSFQLDVVFATILVIGLVGLLFDRGILWFERRTAQWSLHAAA
ncbi:MULTISPECIES: ABC transporter permease [unclassified Beijerinckia]|uniref:ABC transporter permease n=1 Tax=unclassified Beijerinckia TaxID=2638183 RepID=UPI000897FC80|nr:MULTISPECIES: ABC transporter permease [unclassified Beijerinckia]MDH7794045.1 sulfonate transport system permease protein [Beijerinckia sp. GAS462]SEB52090.1 sulfonate transport system permease protein [Beijerinckia sp. 28-YEA-48]